MSQAPLRTPPADRYGRSASSPKRPLVIVGTVLVTLLTAWVGWIAVASSNRPVTFSTLSHQAVDATRMDVTLQITMEPGKRAICTVRSRNAELNVVGSVDVTLGPSTQQVFTSTVSVPTMEKASSGKVKACVLA